KSEIALAAGTAFADCHHCFRSGKCGLRVNSTLRSHRDAEVDVLGLLYKLRCPRRKLRVMPVAGDDWANAENYVSGREQLIDLSEVGQRFAATFSVEILRQRLSRDA